MAVVSALREITLCLGDPGIEPASLESPALAGRFFTTSAIWGSLDKWQTGSIACAALNRWCCCSRQWIEEDSEASMNRRAWTPCDQFVQGMAPGTRVELLSQADGVVDLSQLRPQVQALKLGERRPVFMLRFLNLKRVLAGTVPSACVVLLTLALNRRCTWFQGHSKCNLRYIFFGPFL